MPQNLFTWRILKTKYDVRNIAGLLNYSLSDTTYEQVFCCTSMEHTHRNGSVPSQDKPHDDDDDDDDAWCCPAEKWSFWL